MTTLRLAAVVAADVVGYSRLMSADEVGTIDALKTHRRALVDPAIAEHHGRIVKTTGDLNSPASSMPWLAPSPSNAGCLPAIPRLQRTGALSFESASISATSSSRATTSWAMASMLLREGLCEPGGICISRAARDQVRDKLNFAFADLGEHPVKNFARPIRAFGLSAASIAALPIAPPASVSLQSVSAVDRGAALPLPDKPSIAVLPFQNMSGDPEQEYFADGMVEDIITALSRVPWLFVAARNSSFVYKSRAVDVKQVGRELGVRYVLEGSVRKAAERLRITAQLVDTATGGHLWAERFEGAIADVFSLQDDVTACVTAGLGGKVEQAEFERSSKKPTDSLDAYDYFLRGRYAVGRRTREGFAEAASHFQKATELDPAFALAHAWAAGCIVSKVSFFGFDEDRNREVVEGMKHARLAAEFGFDDAPALAQSAMATIFLGRDWDRARELVDRALALNSNLWDCWARSAWISTFCGEHERAISDAAHATRLHRFNRGLFDMLTVTAFAQFFLRRCDEAVATAAQALREQANASNTTIAAAAYAMAGRLEEAKAMSARMLEVYPEFSVSRLMDYLPLRLSEDRVLYTEGMRKAGLPE